MKTIQELKSGFTLVPEHINYMVRYLKLQQIDFNVYLPSKRKNLQRNFVWTPIQNQELIQSILIGRKIPEIAVLQLTDDTYQIIDGKQRLNAIFEFVDDKFPIIIEDENYIFSQLPIDYQREILGFHIDAQRIYETNDFKLSDEDKISWFKYINFAGTPQDKNHLEGLV